MTLSSRAVTTAVLAAAVAGAAYAGTVPIVGLATVLVVVIAAGWPALVSAPATGGTTIVVLAAGAGAVAVAWRTQGEPMLRHLPIVVAMSLVLAFLAEMLRRDGRPHLVESVSGTVAGAFVAVGASGWVAVQRTQGGSAVVVTAAIAIAVAAAVAALCVARGWVGALVVVVVAAAAGAVAGSVVPGVEPLTGLLAGVVGGLSVGTMRILLARLPSAGGLRAGVAAASVPVAVSGMLVFAVGRLLLG